MKIERILENLGFSQNEIKVYLTLNDNGSTPAGKVSKIAKIDRSSCYNSLKALQEKGLVSYVLIGQVKWFQGTGPKALKEFVKEQLKDVEEILPELHARHKAAKVEGQVRLFKGIKGIRTIFHDMARTGEDNYVFGSEGQFEDRMPAFAKQFDRMKKENNFKTKMIIRKDRSDIEDKKLTNLRYAPIGVESNVVVNIYGSKIALLIWTDEPEGIIIENEEAAKGFKSYFDFMWKNADK